MIFVTFLKKRKNDYIIIYAAKSYFRIAYMNFFMYDKEHSIFICKYIFYQLKARKPCSNYGGNFLKTTGC